MKISFQYFIITSIGINFLGLESIQNFIFPNLSETFAQFQKKIHEDTEREQKIQDQGALNGIFSSIPSSSQIQSKYGISNLTAAQEGLNSLLGGEFSSYQSSGFGQIGNPSPQKCISVDIYNQFYKFMCYETLKEKIEFQDHINHIKPHLYLTIQFDLSYEENMDQDMKKLFTKTDLDRRKQQNCQCGLKNQNLLARNIQIYISLEKNFKFKIPPINPFPERIYHITTEYEKNNEIRFKKKDNDKQSMRVNNDINMMKDNYKQNSGFLQQKLKSKLNSLKSLNQKTLNESDNINNSEDENKFTNKINTSQVKLSDDELPKQEADLLKYKKENKYTLQASSDTLQGFRIKFPLKLVIRIDQIQRQIRSFKQLGSFSCDWTNLEIVSFLQQMLEDDKLINTASTIVYSKYITNFNAEFASEVEKNYLIWQKDILKFNIIKILGIMRNNKKCMQIMDSKQYLYKVQRNSDKFKLERDDLN